MELAKLAILKIYIIGIFCLLLQMCLPTSAVQELPRFHLQRLFNNTTSHHLNQNIPNTSQIEDYVSTNDSRVDQLVFLAASEDQRAKEKGYHEEEEGHLTNFFVIEIAKPDDEVESIVRNLGFQFVRKLFSDEDFYLLRHPDVCHRCIRSADHHVQKLTSDARIQWAEQQSSIHREIRLGIKESDIIHDKSRELPLETLNSDGIGRLLSKSSQSATDSSDMSFNDPLYGDQWYLHNQGQTGGRPHHDINVLPVWRAGITGFGVRVSVLDDGVQKDNPELSHNYEPLVSYDYVHLKSTEESESPEKSHGTYCAAIVAAVANNSYCGVGVAYNARVGGTKILDGTITDSQEAMALTHALEYVDIYTASWGPRDDGRHVAGPNSFTQKALIKGITQGRQGKGVIYVWAAGNGGVYYDNCNADGYASSLYTLTFGAVTDRGLSTYYSEPCAAVIASAYIGGSHIKPDKETIAFSQKKIKVIVPESDGECRETFQGTSAAAPMAAGVIALVLEANADLTWRDVQHIVVESARLPTSTEKGWSVNAAGRHFHLKIGFGVLDAARMVAMAQNWTAVAPLHVCTAKPYNGTKFIYPARTTTVSITVEKDLMDVKKRVDKLENVMATVNITHPRCGDLEIFLVSPSGTVSQVMTRRPLDNETTEFPMWEFTSLHFWAEDPNGKWLLRIADKGQSAYDFGVLNYFSLSVFGTTSRNSPSGSAIPVRALKVKELLSIIKKEKRLSRSTKIRQKNVDFDLTEIRDMSLSIPMEDDLHGFESENILSEHEEKMIGPILPQINIKIFQNFLRNLEKSDISPMCYESYHWMVKTSLKVLISRTTKASRERNAMVEDSPKFVPNFHIPDERRRYLTMWLVNLTRSLKCLKNLDFFRAFRYSWPYLTVGIISRLREDGIRSEVWQTLLNRTVISKSRLRNSVYLLAQLLSKSKS